MENISNIEFLNLTYAYPGSNDYIFRDLQMRFNAGDRIAIIGENGAGKTTLMKLLTGIIKPADPFRSFINGVETTTLKLKQTITFIPTTPGFYSNLNFKQNIAIIQYLWKQNKDFPQRVFDIMAKLNLMQDQDKLVGEYSLGMQYKLGLSIFLAMDIAMYLLDEPLNALDRESQEIVVNLIRQMSSEGKIFFFSSHSDQITNQLASDKVYLSDGVLHH